MADCIDNLCSSSDCCSDYCLVSDVLDFKDNFTWIEDHFTEIEENTTLEE